MDKREIQRLLEDVHADRVSVKDAVKRLRHMPYEDLGYAKIDHHRGLRQGFAEVIYAKGKTPKQISGIVSGMMRQGDTHNILITRADERVYGAIRRLSRQARFHPLSGVISIQRNREVVGKGTILVVAAGTSDIRIAEEALVTAEVTGNRVDHLYDVGVAGLHRLLDYREKIADARVIVCVAGMEGALPSVIAGLVEAPVIAVPTSVGYGASFGGLSALLAMLNSCASNVCVVNIDNGFGAGYVASAINRI